MNVFFLLFKNQGSEAEKTSAIGHTQERLSNQFLNQLSGLTAPPLFAHRNFGDWDLLSWIAPVEHWKIKNELQRGPEWALAPEFPLSLDTAAPLDLCDLGKNLLTHRESVFSKLAPPYSLLYSPDPSKLHIFNDPIGYSPLLTFKKNNEVVAITNKILCLRALDAPLQRDPEDWILRSILKCFPKNRTGFKNIELCGAGTTISLVQNQLQITESGPWIPPALPSVKAEDVVEFSKRGLAQMCRSFSASAGVISGGLTGGYDSRSLFSTFLNLKLPIKARVKGHADSGDVKIAKILSQLAGIPLKTKLEAEQPPLTSADLLSHLRRTGHWHEGQIYSHKFKTFSLDGKNPSVNLLGHDGVLVRDPLQATFEKKNAAGTVFSLKDSILNKDKARLFAPVVHDMIEAYFSEMNAVLDSLPFDEAGRKRYFYVTEQGRRLSAGSKSNQFGIVATPLMNPVNLSICAWYPGSLGSNFIPTSIVEKNFPAWKDVPYFSWESTKAGHHYYDRNEYWRSTGTQVFKKAVAENPLAPYLNSYNSIEDLILLADEITFLYSQSDL